MGKNSRSKLIRVSDGDTIRRRNGYLLPNSTIPLRSRSTKGELGREDGSANSERSKVNHLAQKLKYLRKKVFEMKNLVWGVKNEV